MENEENKELFDMVEKKFDSLSQSSQDLLVSEELLELIKRIATEEQISIPNGSFFENAIFGVLLGVIHSDVFIDIIKTFELPEEKTKTIISRVDSEIFKPVKKMLIKPNLNSNNLDDSVDLNETNDNDDDPYHEKIN